MKNLLFLKYQKELVDLANLKHGREFLGIDKDREVRNNKICALLPNKYIVRTGRNRFKVIVRTYDIFAKRLFYSLGQYNIFRFNEERNPKLYKGLDKYKGLLAYTKLTPTPFPQIFLASGDPIYSSTSDGSMYYGNANWTTCRNSSTGTLYQVTSASSTQVTNVENAGGTYYINRAFYYYDLSGLSSITVTSVVKSVYGYSNGESNCCVMLGTQADPLETGDFDAFSGSAWANTVGWSTTGYNDMTLDEQGESDC
ncbi:MAG: hypothetical protein WC346_04360, partial [Methanogenium sp.]